MKNKSIEENIKLSLLFGKLKKVTLSAILIELKSKVFKFVIVH